ncbi:peptide chain release factor N(5)-glutamine methyltransferase [Devosia sp. PTR5]|uniref:Release factor glutamine methyltransferase n=1 Tax=Devosia oryzisoli TaxID=2774138 RepID=A0A927FXM9_9HYPH|nr:peptide chain release factor N(5)-glutamine methyltransferase [Devosia oryzisoli]MBD8067004.1 peptide chain release factor N(5)-glutamine methyltransferase [Devosia oryzisoli]
MSTADTIGQFWRAWRDRLNRQGIVTATLDAKLLLAHALGVDSLTLAVRENEQVSADAMLRANVLFERRVSGESVARIIGQKGFYGLDFELGPATLEPRPETELLVDLALAALPEGGRVLDLGTGTGCIPIALLVNRPDATAMATDVSAEALEVARRNAERLAVAERLNFAKGDWFDALDATSDGPKFDLVLSNPPYIASAIIRTLSTEVRSFDPLLALDGGPDGLTPYRAIAAQAGCFLKRGGAVMVEIGYDQGEQVSALFERAHFVNISVRKDLAGLDRVVVAHHIGENHSALLSQD